MLRIFSLRPGLNPRSWVPEVSMLTTRPPKPLTSELLEIQIKWVVYHITCGYVACVSGGRDSVHIGTLSWQAQQTEPRQTGTRAT
jgi:hypothetical protein